MRRPKARFFVWADTKRCCGVRWRSTSVGCRCCSNRPCLDAE
ncbi:ABC transporter, ATP-binding protein [Pseudomonas mandelii JR-1]|uniref:ABC transporter, ATP-binding protein n=1 Tax=Pseudomonas mandelii JR-1 TaxID=1147786 RepID=A0A024E7M5_9PSED|nr:ABC transporter, ATP-binding protein [Pseudomonas mandelii JR-1]